MRQFDTEQVLAMSRLACLLCNFRKKKRKEKKAVISFEKENKCLCGYENERHFVLSALEYKYISFFPFYTLLTDFSI